MAEVDTAWVHLYGKTVGAVVWDNDRGRALFEYDAEFCSGELNPSPVVMKTALSKVYQFGLNRETFWGLPGLLADALPDKFGNAIIDQWLSAQGRSLSSFTPIDRLCYVGSRGMGALEFTPTTREKALSQSVEVEVAALVELAQEIMSARGEFNADLGRTEDEAKKGLSDILRVGTSAGGARPKAIIAMNKEGAIRSGQVAAPKGFSHWLIKFDGVNDIELGKPQNYGQIEYAYHLMAKDFGINMTECRLLEENGRAHFMTKRFDRKGNDKVHMQTLCGIAHYDFNMPGAYSYEQTLSVMRVLELPASDMDQLIRRMIFNVVFRNLDDHTKNISFLMDEAGAWSLSPAYDVTYAHNPAGRWTDRHQMSINGKRDGFTRSDIEGVGKLTRVKNTKVLVDKALSIAANWPKYAKSAGLIKKETVEAIGKELLTEMKP
ncbi:MAG: type II toxin-antitoxin system HipA family toxin [Porticoccus sp.]|nr:type II toxin-antitoxin system HipA family toxin [Porticoccus sp.]